VGDLLHELCALLPAEREHEVRRDITYQTCTNCCVGCVPVKTVRGFGDCDMGVFGSTSQSACSLQHGKHATATQLPCATS
jgi:hypothetical protein